MTQKKTWREKYGFWLNCLGLVFGILTTVFLFYLGSFYVGNHDYKYMRYGVKMTEGLWEGRFTQFVLPVILTEGQLLPIFSALVGFLFFSAAAVLSACWYGVRKDYIPVVLYSLLIVLNPYLLTQIWYVHSVISVLFWPLLCVVGMMLIFKGAEEGKILYAFGGCLCLFISMGGYAASFELALVLVFGKFSADVMQGRKADRAAIFAYVKAGGWIAAAGLLYRGAIAYLRYKMWLSRGMYNIQMLPVKDMWVKFRERWDEPLRVLTDGFPYCSDVVVWCLCGLAAAALWATYCRRRFVMGLLGIVGLLYVSFTMAFMSPKDFFYTYRIHFFSVPYVGAILFATASAGGRKWLGNAAFALALVLTLSYAKADLTAQKVWVSGDKLDERTADRVRSELMSELVPGQHYRLFVHGGFYGREKFTGDEYVYGEDRERLRELYGYSKFLHHIFSAGLFLYEAENPIWGDAMFIKDTFIYVLSGNEQLTQEDKESAIFFAAKVDFEEPPDLILGLSNFPARPYFFVGKKSIYLKLGYQRSIERF